MLALLYNMLLFLSSINFLTIYAVIPPNARRDCSNFMCFSFNWRVLFILRCLQSMSESEAVMQDVNRIVWFQVGVACTERLLQDKRYQKILGPRNYSTRSVWCAVGQPVVDLYACWVRTGCLYGHQRHINPDRKCVSVTTCHASCKLKSNASHIKFFYVSKDANCSVQIFSFILLQGHAKFSECKTHWRRNKSGFNNR